jgi:hypothetical protein
MINTIFNWILLHSPDDAYLYMQLAKNPGMYLKTNGFQPLWAWIITIIGLLAKGNVLVFIDCGLFLTIIIAIPFVVKKLYNTWLGFAIWLIPALWIGNLMMELAIAILLIFIALKYSKGKNGIIWSALMVYARLDLLPLAIMITPWKKWWKLALCFIPWIIFNLIIFKSIFPDSMMHTAIATSSGLNKDNSWQWILTVLNTYYIAIPIIIIGLIGCTKNKRYGWYLIAEFVFLLVLDIIKNSAYAWHYTVIPVIIVIGYEEWWNWINSKEWFIKFKTGTDALKYKGIELIKVASFTAIICILLLLVVWSWQGELIVYNYKCNEAWYKAKDIEVDGTRGAFNAGIQGYFSKQEVVDIGGYFIHKVVMPEYLTDDSSFIPDGYILVKDYNEPSVYGNFGLYKKVQ